MLFSMGIIVGGVSLSILNNRRKKRGAIFRKQLLKQRLEANKEQLKIEEKQPDKAERKLDRDLKISTTSLMLTGVGFFYAPLNLLSLPGLLWINIVVAKDAYSAYRQGRGIGVDALGMVFHTGCIATGNYFAAALGGAFSRFSKKLLIKTEDRSKQSLIDIFDNQVRSVWLYTDGIELEIPVDQLKSGDVIVVHAGEMIAVDGIIISGTGAIDQRILTGESQPVEKKEGDTVFASTIILSGIINIRVEKAGKQTVADQIGKVLNETVDFKQQILSQGEQLADRSARFSMGLSLLTLPFFGVITAITVLNASFGFYMRALAPISMLTFLNLASHRGLLIKDGRSLQLLNQVDTVVFDKTGTLTLDKPHVSHIYTCEGIDDKTLLSYAAAVEYKQTHPIALAIKEMAQHHHLDIPRTQDIHYDMGYGLTASIDGKRVRVGSRRFVEMSHIHIPDTLMQFDIKQPESGCSFVYLAVDEKLWGIIELQATLRPEAKQVIEQLKQRHIEMYIISGDHEEPTKKLAKEVGIEHYFAEILPEDKAKLVDELQAKGKSVCFVGDGINDSIALKKATVSISLQGASSVATDAAQIILMQQNLKQLIQALDLAKKFEKNMQLNLTATVVPGIITLYGAFFLHFGVLAAVILNDIGVVVGASNAIFPHYKSGYKEPLSELRDESSVSLNNKGKYDAN